MKIDLFAEAKQKLEIAIDVLKNAGDYTQDIKTVLHVLDDGLQFTKLYYSELNSQALSQTQSFKGSDIYFYFMRFTHQFFNVMNIVNTLPNASYYEKFLHLLQVRQQKFDELCKEAIKKGQEITK